MELSPRAKRRFRRQFLIQDSNICWEWGGRFADHKPRKTDHYGIFKTREFSWFAHRFVYDRYHGPIPDGMTVDHMCFNIRCVNPGHLRLLKHSENARLQPRRLANVCTNGHPYGD